MAIDITIHGMLRLVGKVKAHLTLKRNSVKRSHKLLVISVLTQICVAVFANSCSSSCPTPQSGCTPPCRTPTTIFLPRSQGVNTPRELVGVQPYINLFDVEELYGAFSVTGEYTRSFRPDIIATDLWGLASANGAVTFSGSRASERKPFDILADYFGLPVNFKSVVHFEPRIENAIVDFNLYLGFDEWAKNVYMKFYFPLTYTRWSLNPSEAIIQQGTIGYDAGYMNINSIQPANLPTSVLQAMNGKATWGDMQEPLKFGKISCDALTKILLADIQVVLGYNFVNADNYHLGINLQTSFPTGNRPNAEYLFEPIVGNGGHFELGGGISSHALLWENENHSIAAYLESNITHLFNARQLRSFDFYINGPTSRYILAAGYQAIPRNPLTKQPLDLHLTNPNTSVEYNGQLTPAINIATVCCDTSMALQTETTLKLAYTYKNFTLDLGYNLWTRSKEKITLREPVNNESHPYALKGDAFMYGVALTGQMNDDATVNAARAGYPTNSVPLSASQKAYATIHHGGNFNTYQTVQGQLNPGIDSATNAATTVGGAPRIVVSPIMNDPITSDRISNSAICTSTPPQIMGLDDLNLESAASPAQLSNKLFAHINYAWNNGIPGKEKLIPFLGIGGEVEFAKRSHNLSCVSCECQSALSQWGVWLKTGFGF